MATRLKAPFTYIGTHFAICPVSWLTIKTLNHTPDTTGWGD